MSVHGAVDRVTCGQQRASTKKHTCFCTECDAMTRTCAMFCSFVHSQAAPFKKIIVCWMHQHVHVHVHVHVLHENVSLLCCCFVDRCCMGHVNPIQSHPRRRYVHNTYTPMQHMQHSSHATRSNIPATYVRCRYDMCMMIVHVLM